tara:strand:+ start:565 stop:831 length:267 start_codon:yes stop_codon:yes gene_type:complete
MRALLTVSILVLSFGCGEDTPVPDYPFPPQPPVAERPGLSQYVGGGDAWEDEEPVEEEDEEWDDGLSDEDLEMDGSGDADDAAETEGD